MNINIPGITPVDPSASAGSTTGTLPYLDPYTYKDTYTLANLTTSTDLTVEIRLVNNGYIIKVKGNEYIASTIEELIQYIPKLKEK